MHPHSSEREMPHRWQAIAFYGKTRLFQLRRKVAEIGKRPLEHGKARALIDAPKTYASPHARFTA